jgi:hypothetical protein
VPLRRRSRPARWSCGKRWTSRCTATVASSRAQRSSKAVMDAGREGQMLRPARTGQVEPVGVVVRIGVAVGAGQVEHHHRPLGHRDSGQLQIGQRRSDRALHRWVPAQSLLNRSGRESGILDQGLPLAPGSLARSRSAADEGSLAFTINATSKRHPPRSCARKHVLEAKRAPRGLAQRRPMPGAAIVDIGACTRSRTSRPARTARHRQNLRIDIFRE